MAHQKVKVHIADHPLTVEIVNTPESVTQGLSGRDSIGSDGMLFLFPQSDQWNFWMKDMKFDLDMIWLQDGRVVDITKAVSAPRVTTPDEKLPTYSPRVPANMVLEISSGNSEQWDIKIGDLLLLDTSPKK